MYRCDMCDSIFSEPENVRYSYEDYNGVAGMFTDNHYGYYEACPYCGSEEIHSHVEESEDGVIWED